MKYIFFILSKYFFLFLLLSPLLALLLLPFYLAFFIWMRRKARKIKTAFIPAASTLVLYILFIASGFWVEKFFISFSAKAKTSEAKINLGAIASAQKAYRERTGTYAGGLKAFRLIGWEPAGQNRYAYYLGDDFIRNLLPSGGVTIPNLEDWPYTVRPYVTDNGFVALAIGNIDNDSFADLWMIKEDGRLHNVLDDVNNIEVRPIMKQESGIAIRCYNELKKLIFSQIFIFSALFLAILSLILVPYGIYKEFKKYSTLTPLAKADKYKTMEYDMPLFRPPSEADSLILQATYGCSANSCTFCLMYKSKRFRIRRFEEFKRDVEFSAERVPAARRIFLADGDALVIRASQLLAILELLYQRFPRLERVTAYANPLNLLTKSQAELDQIRRAGLTMLYYGVESGDDQILRRVKKKAETPGMIAGCAKAHAAGFELSVTVLLGLGGKKLSRRHAENTARALNAIQPRYASALTLMLGPLEKYFAESMGENFQFLDMMETLQELRRLVEGLELKNTVFRSNHASNYLALRGDLPRDKKKLLAVIDSALADPDSPLIRPEYFRAL